MRILYTGVLALGLAAFALSQTARGDQGDAANGLPPLPYKAIDWPTQPTSAAGFAAPWNFIQVSGVAVTQGGTVLVLHRGAFPLLEFESGGKLIRPAKAPAFSEGKVAGIPKNNWAP